MLLQHHTVLQQLQRGMQAVSHFIIIASAIALVAATAAAIFGALPWPEVSLRWGGQYIPDAGMYAQLGLTALLVMVCFFLPANTRMSRLERSHRSFQISMEDIRRAYDAVHQADRRSVFSLSSEFDEMRKRMEYLREHPDLSHLEPELLEIAAQMSHRSRDLARVYSADRVDRAKTFLKQRQEEVAAMQERLLLARTTCDELRRWMSDIEAGERENGKGLRALENDLKEILPTLGYDVDDMRDANVVALTKQPTHPSPTHPNLGPQKQ
ncbi:DNA repair protein [Pseudorhodobacter sp.]|uniref:DNA repair protein n=1 Tax=Pseudorhodobacter sp. TaxID=1934400 RepID=UPI0026493E1C|nr:DNA repair protein [Pseudorhodobacter sp.]MDN5786433.1 DNA repair protein [Pseudorhodobacter sp.]